MACFDRTGRKPQTARANIVTWPDRRVWHVVDTESPCWGRGRIGCELWARRIWASKWHWMPRSQVARC